MVKTLTYAHICIEIEQISDANYTTDLQLLSESSMVILVILRLKMLGKLKLSPAKAPTIFYNK